VLFVKLKKLTNSSFLQYISARTLLKGIENFNAMTSASHQGNNTQNQQPKASDARAEQFHKSSMNRYLTTIRIVEKGWVSLNVLCSEFDNRKYGSGQHGIPGVSESKVLVEKS